MKPTICPYCGGKVNFKDSDVIYGKSYGMVYICEHYPSCDAFVGVHKNSKTALGRLANAELRDFKKKAHRYFDPFWKYRNIVTSTTSSRGKAYSWLASEMNMNLETCHIGMFNVEQCKQIIGICELAYEKYPKIKSYALSIYGSL